MQFIFIFTCHWTLSPALNEHQQFKVIFIKSSFLFYFPAWKQVWPNAARRAEIASVNGDKVVSMWLQSCLKVVIGCLKAWKIVQKMFSFYLKLSQSCLRVLSQSYLKDVPKLSQNWPKIVLRLSGEWRGASWLNWRFNEVAAIAWAQLRTGVNWESGMCQ